MLLEGQVAIVTGAGSGIGRAGATALAREGATVVLVDRNAECAADAAEEIGRAGGRAEAMVADVTDDAAIERVISATVERHGRIDILHNHAGIQVAGSLEEVTPEGLDDSYRVNVRAHFVAARLAVRHMKVRGGGTIINTSSNSGVFLDRGMLAYITTKAAVITMTKQMALDYARYNIRVNALCPGWVDTPFNEPYMNQMGGREALERYVRETIPMGRWASAEEIAESILFLASPRSSYITGHALVVDGGECLG